jgi:uncharacterized membrane protein YqjE
MTDLGSQPGEDESPGFIESLKEAAALVSSMVHTRLDLFVAELEEERERLRQTLLLTLLMFFGISLGFILLTIFLVALFLAQGWLAALGVLTLLYLGVGIGAATKLRQNIRNRPKLFAATLEELGKDRDLCQGDHRE